MDVAAILCGAQHERKKKKKGARLVCRRLKKCRRHRGRRGSTGATGPTGAGATGPTGPTGTNGSGTSINGAVPGFLVGPYLTTQIYTFYYAATTVGAVTTVTLWLPAFSFASSGSAAALPISGTAGFPPAIAPPAATSFFVSVLNNSVIQGGVVLVSAAGGFKIYGTLAQGPYTPGGNAGIVQDIYLTWTVT